MRLRVRVCACVFVCLCVFTKGDKIILLPSSILSFTDDAFTHTQPHAHTHTHTPIQTDLCTDTKEWQNIATTVPAL